MIHRKSVNSKEEKVFSLVGLATDDEGETFQTIQAFIYFGGTSLSEATIDMVLRWSMERLGDHRKPRAILTACLNIQSFLLALGSTTNMQVLERIEQQLIRSLSSPNLQPLITAK